MYYTNSNDLTLDDNMPLIERQAQRPLIRVCETMASSNHASKIKRHQSSATVSVKGNTIKSAQRFTPAYSRVALTHGLQAMMARNIMLSNSLE